MGQGKRTNHILPRFIGFMLALAVLLHAAPLTAYAAGGDSLPIDESIPAGEPLPGGVEDGLPDDAAPDPELPEPAPEPEQDVPEEPPAADGPEEGPLLTASDLVEDFPLAGNGTPTDPFKISSPQELADVATYVNAGNYVNPIVEGEATTLLLSQAHYILTANVDLSQREDDWIPIGTDNSSTFRGGFNGNGKIITGLTLSSTSAYNGLFGYVFGATLTNIIIDVGAGDAGGVHGTSVESTATGGVVGYASDSILTGLENRGVPVGGASTYIGGVVGRVAGCTVTDCKNMATVHNTLSGAYVGGVAGCASSYTNESDTLLSAITRCSNSGAIGLAGEGARAGGVVAYMISGTVTDSKNTGDVIGGTAAGGVVGTASGAEVTGCTNTAAVRSTSTGGVYVGGIAGTISASASLTGCYNSGAVGMAGDTAHAGGVAGYADTATITDSVNTGVVFGSNTGGIVGFLYGGSGVERCINFGAVGSANSTPLVGGIVGVSAAKEDKDGDGKVIATYKGYIENSVSATAEMGPIPANSASRNYINRILGYDSGAFTLSGNHGFFYATLNGSAHSWTPSGATGLNGQSEEREDLTDPAFWAGLGYDSALWFAESGKFPYLTAFEDYNDGLPDLPDAPDRQLVRYMVSKTSLTSQREIQSTSAGILSIPMGWTDTLAEAKEDEFNKLGFEWKLDLNGNPAGPYWKASSLVNNPYGQEYTLCLPKNYACTSGNPLIITVEGPKMPEGFGYTLMVTAPLAGIGVSPATARVAPGGTVDITPYPTSAAAQKEFDTATVAWSLSDDSLADLGAPAATAAPVTVTVKNSAAPGATFTVTATVKSSKDKILTATCRVAVISNATGLSVPASLTMKAGATRTVVPSAIPAGASLPTITPTSSDSEVVAVASTDGGFVLTAQKAGTATITYNDSDNRLRASTLVTVAPADAGLYGQCGIKVGGAAAQTLDAALNDVFSISFDATSTPAGTQVLWSSSDERVATVHMGSGYATGAPCDAGDALTLRANAPGTATIYAATTDGLAVARLKVVVADPRGVTVPDFIFVLSRASMLENTNTVSYAYTGAIPSSMTATLYDAVTHKAEMTNLTATQTASDTIEIVFGTAPQPGQYILAVADSANAANQAELRLDVYAADTDYAQPELATTKATIYTKSTGAASVPLYFNGATSHSLLSDSSNEVRFAGSDANADTLNRLFTVKCLDGSTLSVTYDATKLNPGEAQKKSYSGTLEVTGTGDQRQTIKGKLTLSMNTKLLTLTAAAQTVNFFTSAVDGADQTVPVDITAANVELAGLEFNSSKTQPAFVVSGSTVTLDPANPVITVKAGVKKQTGTVHLLATVDGWSEKLPLSVKITRNYTPPGLKLSSSRVNVHTAAGATGTVVTLLPKSSKDSLAALGVYDVQVARLPTDAELASVTDIGLRDKYRFSETTYPLQNDYQVAAYNPKTGQITLKAATAAPGKGKLLLAVRVDGTEDTVKLAVNVTPTTGTTKASLAASKKSFTLNPNLSGGDSLDVLFTPSLPGIDVEGLGLTYSFTTAPKYNEAAPDVQILGNVVRVSAVDGTTAKTWKIKVTAPALYQKNGVGVPVSVTLNVKVLAKDAARYGAVTPTLAVKGKLDLTTGAAATLTVKLSNTAQFLADTAAPSFTIIAPDGTAPTPAQQACFTFTRTGDTTWRLGLDYAKLAGTNLPMGKYTLKMETGTRLSGGTAVGATAKGASFTVQASKPKVTQSVKKATLYKGDAASRQLIQLTLPGNVPALKTGTATDHAADAFDLLGVTLRASKVAAYYQVVPVVPEQGLYAITFNPGMDPADALGGTLTLELWLQGQQYAAGKPATTVKVSVTAQKIAK